MYGFRREELGYSDARVNKRLKTAERFATLSIRMEIFPGIDDEVEMQEGLTEDMAAEEELS
jgi:hypothetical protein